MDAVGLSWPECGTAPWDPPLTPRGREQIRTSLEAACQAGVECIVASPMRRTVESAEIASGVLGVRFHIDCGLVEWQNADWFSSLAVGDADWYRNSIYWNGNFLASAPPSFPETESEAQQRCMRAAEFWMRRRAGNLLILAHENGIVGIANGLFGDNLVSVPFGAVLSLES